MSSQIHGSRVVNHVFPVYAGGKLGKRLEGKFGGREGGKARRNLTALVGIGRRARLRAVWAYAREGSIPFQSNSRERLA